MKLLVSPLSKGAYFADHLQVAQAEFKVVFPAAACSIKQFSNLDFIETDLSEQQIDQVARLSFVQGIFTETRSGDLKPLPVDHKFTLPEEFVFGVKYPGKTNELLTQLLINLGLAYGLEQEQYARTGRAIRLLDPMAGRGTSLFWAARYGLEALGIEQDSRALSAFEQHGKKTCKLQRIKHKFTQGVVGGGKKSSSPKFSQFEFSGCNIRLVNGDSRIADQVTSKRIFDLIVSDLPYGVQHSTGGGTRNPLAVLEQCLPVWEKCLNKTGAMVLAFNSYQPKRVSLIAAAKEHGLIDVGFSAAHRMSESIVRDVVIFKKD